MRVILQQDVDNLGYVGDIVKVKDGFARNYLVPRGFAVIADERNVRRLEHQKRMASAKAAKEVARAKEMATQLENNPITIKRSAGDGEENRLFGSVTNRDIAEAYAAEGFTIDRRQIVLQENIRKVGKFEIPVRLERGVQATITVWVVAENA
jgi:large subunit ribosomal protein L9